MENFKKMKLYKIKCETKTYPGIKKVNIFVVSEDMENAIIKLKKYYEINKIIKIKYITTKIILS
jgi:hypothetical protein